jgi:hypothetical protein
MSAPTLDLSWKTHFGRRKVIFVKKSPIVAFLAVLTSILVSAQDTTPLKGGISGVVRYPDGSPCPNATVQAVTSCKNDVHLNLVKEVRTANDGSFYVPPFLTSGCNHIRLNAKKVEDLWLKTGHDVFYEADNGTSPEIDAPWIGSPATTEISLGKQGGLVSFRVRDKASDRFVWAELQLDRKPVQGAKFGSMRIATGRDGSPDTLLLPAGQYEIFLESYSCHGKDYFTDHPPLLELLTVKAGEKVSKDFSVDLRAIKPMRSYGNPGAKPCEPWPIKTGS